MPQFALPDNQDTPTKVFEGDQVALVTEMIRFEFGPPELKLALRHPRKAACWVWVSMPETSVDKNSLPKSREYQVGAAGKVFAVETVAKAHAMDQAPHGNFGFRVLASDAAHPMATSFPV